MAESLEQVCPKLLVDFECAQDCQRLERATGNTQRSQLIQEYGAMLEARRRVCHIAETPKQLIALLRAALQK